MYSTSGSQVASICSHSSSSIIRPRAVAVRGGIVAIHLVTIVSWRWRWGFYQLSGTQDCCSSVIGDVMRRALLPWPLIDRVIPVACSWRHAPRVVRRRTQRRTVRTRVATEHHTQVYTTAECIDQAYMVKQKQEKCYISGTITGVTITSGGALGARAPTPRSLCSVTQNSAKICSKTRHFHAKKRKFSGEGAHALPHIPSPWRGDASPHDPPIKCLHYNEILATPLETVKFFFAKFTM